MRPILYLLASSLLLPLLLRADDGYRFWLRYDPIADSALRQAYVGAMTSGDFFQYAW